MSAEEGIVGRRSIHLALVEWKSQPVALISVLARSAPRVCLSMNDSVDTVWDALSSEGRLPDRVLLHIDATQPGRVLRLHAAVIERLRAHRVALWNERVLDISKPAVQRLNRRLGLPHTGASPLGRPTDRIIVKTFWNVRGDNEAALSPDERAALGYPPQWRSPLDGAVEYEVLMREQIPSSWWTRRGLFLERFVTNTEGNYYRVYLAGAAVAVCAFRSDKLVKRPEHTTTSEAYHLHREVASEPSLRVVLPTPISWVFANAVKFANALGLDYGAVDLVCDDRGTSYVVDVNPTPSRGGEVSSEFCSHLQSGLGTSSNSRL